MSRQANPKLVGGFVLGAAALIVAAVLLLADGGFWRDRPRYIMYFEGSATGLQVGSPVVFRGVKIGSVESIGLSVDESRLDFLVPVVVRTDQYVLKNVEGKSVALDDIAENSELLQRGLRARLKTWSFLTGQLYIDLDFYQDRPLTLHGKGEGIPEIPTLPTEVEEFTNKLDKLNVEQLVEDISTISESVRELVTSPEVAHALASLDQTLEHLSSLTARLDKRANVVSRDVQTVMDEAAATLRTTRATLEESAETLRAGRQTLARIDEGARNVAALTRGDSAPMRAITHASEELANTAKALRDAAGENSVTHYQLSEMLEETTAAARALRLLAEALEAQPESVLSGRRGDAP
ncbi:MAG TPA: MlaD family protein [Gammaproteobacteria bacterium]|nr:MlaD family protein [Gammaproteobacteria bacterium]